MKETQICHHILPLGVALLWSLVGCSAPGQGGSPVNGNGGEGVGGGSNSGVGTSGLGGSALGGSSGTNKVSGAGGTSVGGVSSTSNTGGSAGGQTNTKTQGGTSSSATSGTKTSGGNSSTGGSSTSTAGSSQAGTSSRGGTSSTGGKSSSITTPGGGVGGVTSGGKASTGGSSSINTGGQTTSTDAAPTAITGLKVEANPKNVLSAFVSWTTDKAADSTVQFGQGKYEWEISDPANVTSHKVLIIGMYASKAYQIKAISSNGGGSVNGTTTFTTGALPAAIPVAKVTSADSTKVQPGWTLVNVLRASSSAAPISNDPSMAVMYDLTGQPVWYYINGTTKDFGGAIATHLTDKGVLIGPVIAQSGNGESPREVDFAGNTIWECKDVICGGTGPITHDAIKLSNGNHVVVRWKSIGTTTDSESTFDEIDASGKVVWTMSFTKLTGKPSGASGDWCHGNSITIDIEKDEVYANCRFMGLVKTKYSNPNTLLWFLPASYGKATTGTLTFSPTSAQYSDTHDPEPHDDGTVLFFDNGGYSTSMMSGTTYHSRAVEYQIDETKKTATLVWEFPGTFNVDTWYKNNWYTQYYGDADRLPNGNVLITAGSVSANNGDTRVFEVMKADGKVVWEFKLDAGYGMYRADRITPPLVKAISQ